MRFEDLGIQVPYGKAGNIKTKCPVCGNKPGHGNRKDLSVNVSEGTYHCHSGSCTFKGTIKTQIKNEVVYKKPEWKNGTQLSDNAVKWFEKRGIHQQTLRQMKISEGMEYMPQVEKEVNTIQFNYFRNEELINIKFRDAAKNFKMSQGAELILYNLDAIKDKKSIIIVEGEMDCLALIECGFDNVVSVPNGANKNLQYLDNCFEHIENVTEFIIWVDNDRAGEILKEELLRRFGRENCKVIKSEPEKDANDVLQFKGKDAVLSYIKNAEEIKIEGVFQIVDFDESLDELFVNGMKKGCEIFHTELDELITWQLGLVAIITGIPGHGKGEFVDDVLWRLNKYHEWKAGYFSPENYPHELHASKIISKFTGKYFSVNSISREEYMQTKLHLQTNYFFIHPKDEDFSLDTILAKGKYLVRKHGIKVLVIDPWNRLEHMIPNGLSETNYISRQLDVIQTFAQVNNVLVILVAHPRKIQKKDNVYEVPNLYDINGSANFYNKCDYGITIYRNKLEKQVEAHVQKVRFKHLGQTGSCAFTYDFTSGRLNDKIGMFANEIEKRPKEPKIEFKQDITPQNFSEPTEKDKF